MFDLTPQAVAVAVEVEREVGYVRPGAYKHKSIDYIDPAPKPFIVQIPLVEYFERIKRLKADKWQVHFCNYLQTAVENQHIKPTFAEFHAQAQLGKTIILSQVFPAWCLGHSPLFRYVLAMYNISRSEAHADVVIQIMRSELHRQIFTDTAGHLPKFASKSGFMTNARRDAEGGRMDAQMSLNPIGLESGMTGSGFEWLTIDDPYKEPRDAWSLTVYDNLARLWEYGVKPRLAAHSCVGAMFHRYNYDDYGGYLLNTGKFDYVRYAAVADGPYIHQETGQRFEDPLGRTDGELICPERFPESYYRDKFDDDKVKLSMFQGRPGRDEGDFFKVGMIGEATDEDWSQCSLRARGWDHAATHGAGDQSAGGLLGFQPTETVIVADVFSAQLDTSNRVEKQKELAVSDGVGVTVVVPEGISADGKDNVFMMRQNLQGFNVVARKVTNAAPGSDAKKRRAYMFSVAVNAGRVKFLAGAWVERVKMLMRRFGNSLSGDDEIDALSDAYNHLYEEFHKGLVIKNFRHFQNWKDFAFTPPPKNGDAPTPQIPRHWAVYAALKITPEDNLPNSGVIVARAAENSGLKDTLFIVDEYKAFTSAYNELFDWLDRSLKTHCEGYKSTMVWLHPESEMYAATIRQKLNISVSVFDQDERAGIVEANWYTQNNKLIGLVKDAGGLPNAKQESGTWGFNDKGEPTKIGAVLDCLRIIAHRFKTFATELTDNEIVEQAMPAEYKISTMLAKSPYKKGLTDSQQMARSLMEAEVRERLKIPRQDPDWLPGASERDFDDMEAGGW